MSADGVFVIGASGHAKVVIDIIERQSLWRIAVRARRLWPMQCLDAKPVYRP
jgi:hypothetical protein